MAERFVRIVKQAISFFSLKNGVATAICEIVYQLPGEKLKKTIKRAGLIDPGKALKK